MRFFQVDFDSDQFPRWYLDDPLDDAGNPIDADLFTIGQSYGQPSTSLYVPLQYNGPAMTFNLADHNLPIVLKRLSDLLASLVGASVELLSARVENSEDNWVIMNVLDVVDCFDEEHSKYTRWGPNDGRPDKIDQLRMVVDLKIDPAKASGHKVFRVKGWEIALIVDEDVKNLLASEGATGIRFTQVA